MQENIHHQNEYTNAGFIWEETLTLLFIPILAEVKQEQLIYACGKMWKCSFIHYHSYLTSPPSPFMITPSNASDIA